MIFDRNSPLSKLFKLIIIKTFIVIVNTQYVVHFNEQNLIGQISFQVSKSSNELIVNATINDVRHEVNHTLGDYIKFEWSLHSNLLPVKEKSIPCSSDDLGEPLRKNRITDSNLISLNQVNIWKFKLDDIINELNVNNLGSFLWGRSVLLRLKQPNQTKEEVTVIKSLSKPNPTLPSERRPKPVLSKPQITGPPLSTSSNIPTPKKPTFAPRPKPQISQKFKTPSVSVVLPKIQSLVAESLIKESITNETSLNQTSPIEHDSINTKKIDEDEIIKRGQALYGSLRLCSNVIDTRDVKTAEAVFSNTIGGRVVIRGNEDGITLISSNLYHLKSKISTKNDWKILANDILDEQNHDDKCKYLHLLFNPDDIDDKNCSKNNTGSCKIGDLTKKHGQIQVTGLGRTSRATYTDFNLPLSSLEGSRGLYLTIFDTSITSHDERGKPIQPKILSCAKFIRVESRTAEAQFSMDGVRGSIKFHQRYIGEPVSIGYDLFGLEGNIKHLSIKTLPMPPRSSSENIQLCKSLGPVFNPYRVMQQPDKSRLTIDQYPVGSLSLKHGELSVVDAEYEDHYKGEYKDFNVQLFGPQSIIGRSIAINKNNDEPWVCANLDQIEARIIYAIATFKYPVVGRVIFQQLEDYPDSETGVLLDLYNPNSDRESTSLTWMIHVHESMADFYNWSERCDSAGTVFDPLQSGTGLTNEVYNKQCQSGISSNEALRCKLGDTSHKSGIKLTLPISQINKSRYYYLDPFLPLSGPNSIIARSVVIYDDNSQTQRGPRLACSTINRLHPIKATVKTWSSGPSIPSNVKGSINFEQSILGKATQIGIDISGLNGNVEHYGLHEIWTSNDREFPCSNDSLYGIYDPYNIENSVKLPPSALSSSLATDDRVKVGDLSRKYGTFEGQNNIHKKLQDQNAPLFALKSIIGRSIVLRASANDFRWVCGTVELDYDKSDSREIIGLASFDDARSKVSGFIRLYQLEHKDSSLSDTFMHIDLKLQTQIHHRPDISLTHNWEIHVNQVGEDAFIGTDEVRCIGSGFKWNPYLAQDKLDSYPTSCNTDYHQACAMGDLGMRHGPLVLESNRKRVISDSNLPLTGNYSVMGRSIVIFDPTRPGIKLACANIHPDIHLKSNVVIRRTPSFTVAGFVDQMRELLGATEWLMVPDLRATLSIADGECVQMTIHFYGTKAHQFQSELNNLITLGTVRRSTRIGTEKISTHYKLCRVGETKLNVGRRN